MKFFDDIPGYPRLMSAKAKREDEPPRDEYFFTLFPEDDDEVPTPSAPPAAIPAAIPISIIPLLIPPPNPVPPIDFVQLFDDTEQGTDSEAEEEEVDWVATEGESIAHRVSARRCAQFASFGDLL